MKRGSFLHVMTGLFLAAAGCAGSHAVFRSGGDMPYPPKAEPKVEEIYHLPTGHKMSFDGMMDIVSGARLVCIGETHDNMHAHRVELLVIRELLRRFPGKVAIGMEMFREPDQGSLDRWTRGELSEIEFLRAVNWYENWGSDFGYYRDILEFAKENRIDVLALNPPKELQQEVRRVGIDNLAEGVRTKLPEIDDTDIYARASAKAVYGGHLPTEGMFETFFRVQLLWEESMAQRVVDYLKSPRGEGKKMVTLTGGWHVRYGFGLPKKVLRRLPMPYTIILSEEISLPREKEGRIMNVELPDIPLLSADFYWMVPYEGLEGKQVALGVNLAADDNAVFVEAVTPGSSAEKAGIAKGDRLLSIDGQRIRDVTDVFLLVRARKEGDRAPVVVVRDGVEKTFPVTFIPLPGKGTH
jgi:uncharacterized iron-regulated protein